MKRITFLSCIILWAATSILGQEVQEVDVVEFKELKAHIDRPSEKVKVYNFWATWCKPCIKELSYFEGLSEEFNGKVEVYLVSLDFVENLESRVLPFIKKKDIKSQVMLLNDTDYNTWIDKIDPSWSGAIPATLITNPSHGKRGFYEKEFEKTELYKIMDEFVNRT